MNIFINNCIFNLVNQNSFLQRICKIFVIITFTIIGEQISAQDTHSFKPKLNTVGSSEEVWALDASNNKLLYHQNLNTFRYDEISSNIAVDELDVSLEGVVVALSGKKLYVWEEGNQSFELQGTSQKCSLSP